MQNCNTLNMYNYMRLSSDGDVAVEMLERAQDCVICMQPFDVSGSEATAVTPCDHVRDAGRVCVMGCFATDFGFVCRCFTRRVCSRFQPLALSFISHFKP